MAVKTLKDNAAEKEKSDLLQEIQIMQQVGATHPNIVTLLGQNWRYFRIQYCNVSSAKLRFSFGDNITLL